MYCPAVEALAALEAEQIDACRVIGPPENMLTVLIEQVGFCADHFVSLPCEESLATLA